MVTNPFVTVLLPVFNETNVIDRLLNYCTSFTFPNYEVIVVDDSTDDTTLKLEKWDNQQNVKVLHRDSRRGWKAGALNEGLKHANPKSTHVLVLDADFVPPKDLLQDFLSRFTNEKIAVVQGRQLYDLNDNENFLTKSYSVMTISYQIVEMMAKQQLDLLVPITGSVFMIRTDILKKIQFDEESITEDWNLAVRLMDEGYKIVYDPNITASGECPSTLTRFFRQTIRWSEGIVRDFRKLFWKTLKSKVLTWKQKLEFVHMGYVYLNSLLLIACTISGLVGASSLQEVLTFPYTLASILFAFISLFSYIVTTGIALSLTNQSLFNIPYALVLPYIVVPITAYASLKGLFTNKGVFNRTYKTGKVTNLADFFKGSPLNLGFRSTKRAR
jgi:cellulose synthase/poly-beta-1,6-N-acetylglucosamine synthase-like glycosyltransferase